MARRSLTLVCALVAVTIATSGVAAIGETVSASLGLVPGGGGARGAPAISADGRFVAFTSRFPLTGVATLGRSQLFVRDRVHGVTVMASVDAKGGPGVGDVDDDTEVARYALSADGRFVVFASTAPNLVPVDGNGAMRDVFRKDLLTGAVVLVNRGPSGAQTATEVSGQADVSADGNRVAFVSGAATDLLASDENAEIPDVVVRDIRAARTVLASRSDSGEASTGPVGHPAISGDGTTVAFDASAIAANLVVGDTNGRSDVIVRDLRTSSTKLASVASDGTRPGGARLGDISGDGREVVFETDAAFDPQLDGNAVTDVYLARPFAGAPATTLVSRRRSDGRASNGPSGGPTITSDGSRIAFVSSATDLDPADPNGNVVDGYVASVDGLALRETSRLDGSTPSRPIGSVALAGSGAALAFSYDDGNPTDPLTPGDTNGVTDIFVRERSRLDGVGPRLDVISPTDGSAVNASRIFVAATVTDPSGVASVTINGRPAVVSADGGIAARLAIVGDAVVTIAATDSAGNRSDRVLGVRRIDQGQPAYGLPGGLPAPTARVTDLRAARSGLRRVTLNFSISGAAVIRARLMRRITPNGAPASWQPVTSWTRVVRSRGRQRLQVAAASLPRGVYQARVLAISTGVRQATSLLVMRGSPNR